MCSLASQRHFLLVSHASLPLAFLRWTMCILTPTESQPKFAASSVYLLATCRPASRKTSKTSGSAKMRSARRSARATPPPSTFPTSSETAVRTELSWRTSILMVHCLVAWVLMMHEAYHCFPNFCTDSMKLHEILPLLR